MVKDVPLDYFTLKEDEFRAFEKDHLFVSYGNPNKSLGYLQQIVLHSTVVPSTGFACFSLKKPVVHAIEQSFKLVRLIREFRLNSSSAHPDGLSLDDLCFQVEDRAIFQEGVSDTIYNALPTFGCLLLAPSQLWDSEDQLRSQQATVFTRLKQASVGNFRDLFFGFMWKMTGISLFAVCARETTISFAITFVLREYHPQFLNQLRDHLLMHFASKQFVINTNYRNLLDGFDFEATNAGLVDSPLVSRFRGPSWGRIDSVNGTKHVYLVWYRVRSYLSDYAPLILIYVVLLLYIYFSVRKLEMVKSKLGLAFSACFTVIASLFMSIGLCINIGLMVPTLNGSEIFPYLVVLIGFENVVVLTKSVVATPIDLPVKYRIAQGLRKESWPLTKQYATQVILLALGFFTFHPTMQEFCLFAVVGVTTDFFLQLFFFVSVLSIDIRRMELSDLSAQYPSSSLIRDPQLLFAPNTLNNPVPEQRSSTTLIHSGSVLSLPPLPLNFLTASLTKLSRCWRAIWAKLRWVLQAYRAIVSPPFRRGHRRRVSAAEAAAFLASDERPTENFPRRLRILRMWANHRLIQRFIVVFMSLWLLIFLLYTVDIAQLLPTAFKSILVIRNGEPSLSPIGTAKPEFVHDGTDLPLESRSVDASVDRNEQITPSTTTTRPSSISQTVQTYTPELNAPSTSHFHKSAPDKQDALDQFTDLPVAHPPRYPTWNQLLLWNYLAFYYWPLLARHYNLSLAGYHSVLLEPMHFQYRTEAESIYTNEDSSGDVSYDTAKSSESTKYSYWNWQPSSNFRFPEFWPTEKYFSPPNMEADNKSKSDTNPFASLTEELLYLFRQSKRGSATDVSPGGLAGWTARLSLTASMLGTTVLCCSLVLMATCLGMIFFKELQPTSSAVLKREPVVRVLPLTIALSETKETSFETDESDSILLPEWTIACGVLSHRAENGDTTMEGIVAVHRCVESTESMPDFYNTIRLWSTDSGLPFNGIQRFSDGTFSLRRAAASALRRSARRRSTVWSMAFFSNGHLLVGCSDGLIEVWNCETSELQNLIALIYSNPDDIAQSQGEGTARSPFQSGGVTVLKIVGPQCFLAGTSRGYTAMLDLQNHTPCLSPPYTPLLPARMWHPHTKPITHIMFTHFSAATFTTNADPCPSNLLILSASEDSHVSFTISYMDEPLYRLSLDTSAIVGFDYDPMVIAVSHASGALYVVRFVLDESEDLSITPTVDSPNIGCPTKLHINVLEQLLVAAGVHASKRCSLNTDATHVQSHVGSVGLKLCADARLQPSLMGSHSSQSLSDFRLVTCELDGNVAVWNLRPPRLLRCFRLNLSTLSPSSPMLSVDGRIVFGDQGYLRVVNPWTAKYERSVQLLPPATSLFSDATNISSTLLCTVLRKWSKELVPIDVAGPYHNSMEPIYHISIKDLCKTEQNEYILNPVITPESNQHSSLSKGSVMVSLADSGRTLVIVPLTTVRST